MTSPTPKLASSPINVGLLFALLILLLIGGEYYTLLNGEQIAIARAVQLTPSSEIAELTPQEKLAARIAAIKEKQRQRKLAKAQMQVGAAGTPTTPTYATEQTLTNQVSSAQAVTKAGQSIKDKLLVKAAKFYGSAGIFLRGLLVIAAIVLVFVQKTPAEEPGTPKRKKIDPKARQVITAICAGMLLIGAYLLLTIHTFTPGFIKFGYPAAAAAVLASGGIAGFLWASAKRPAFGLTTERKKIVKEDAVYLPTSDGGWITIANPYRGVMVLGGAGAGKTYSIGEPLINQFAKLNFSGLIYDFKFPVLAEVAQKAIVMADRHKQAEKEKEAKLAASPIGKLQAKLFTKEPVKGEPPVQLHIINFRDLTRSERVNPIRALDMPVVAFAEEYSRAIINNLNPSSIKKMEFFDTSAVAYLTAIMWFYKKHYPAYCTIPHVVATAMYKDYRHVLSMLETDIESGDQARSLISAVETKADKQVGAVLGTLQVNLTRINSPEVVWVLTPDEEQGEGFSLDLNNPEYPKLLCIGNDPTLKETFSPVVSCIITVAIKLMNQQDKHRSYVFLDEAATMYVPGLETLPATARSNKVATIYMTQGFPQMTDLYGKEKMNVMVDNLNNQFYGKTNSLETAKFISELVGREDREMTSTSSGTSRGGNGQRNSSTNTSTSLQERHLVRVQDTVGLQQGEFIGQTVETTQTFFKGTITRNDVTPERFPLHPMVTFSAEGLEPAAALSQTVMENFLRVRKEATSIINTYPNTFAGASQ